MSFSTYIVGERHTISSNIRDDVGECEEKTSKELARPVLEERYNL